MSPDKPLPITKAIVWKTYQLVKRNWKAACMDGQSMDNFAKDLEKISISSGTGWHQGVTSRHRYGVWRFPNPAVEYALWVSQQWQIAMASGRLRLRTDGGQADTGAPVGTDL